MGISDLVTGALTGGLGLAMGGGAGAEKMKMPETVTPAATKTASQVTAEEDAKKKAALIATNAGGQASAGTLAGNANVTRKLLLGL